jgi:PTH1 family peptidyl-tRNA hydrolase
MPSPDFCVIGLGNPGERYENTRHNVGFHVARELAARTKTDIRRPEFLALTARAELSRSMVLLMEPQTFMNASGRSAAAAKEALGIPAERMLAVYDDLDLPLGRIRLRAEGGHGGHNGMRSLIAELGTESFPRLRVGIGRPTDGASVLEHVLSPFRDDEREAARGAVVRAADAVEAWIADGIERAMERSNVR